VRHKHACSNRRAFRDSAPQTLCPEKICFQHVIKTRNLAILKVYLPPTLKPGYGHYLVRYKHNVAKNTTQTPGFSWSGVTSALCIATCCLMTSWEQPSLLRSTRKHRKTKKKNTDGPVRFLYFCNCLHIGCIRMYQNVRIDCILQSASIWCLRTNPGTTSRQVTYDICGWWIKAQAISICIQRIFKLFCAIKVQLYTNHSSRTNTLQNQHA